MYIKSIRLKNFRNYSEAEITPCEGINILSGDNAQGKTNVLEAIYLCCTGRSHRTVHDKEMVKTGQDYASVHIYGTRSDGLHDVEMLLSRMEKRRVKVAGNTVSRSGELLGHITGVLFSPEDLRMIKDGPAERRRFADMELSQLKPSYYYALQRYARALKQRGALLKDISLGFAETGMLDVWDAQLAENGAQIMEARRAFIEKLALTAAEIHGIVAGNREKLSIEYAPDAVTDASGSELKGALAELLKEARPTDLKRLTTSVGPHRDDISVKINSMEARSFASQGQIRTCALSLKLSEIRIMKSETGESPVLMLDDVMSELDPLRRRLLLGMLEGVQTFVTCTDKDDLAGASAGRFYSVRNAIITEN